jgi:hypothetical protein
MNARTGHATKRSAIMAVPVMRWIGERIAAALPAEKTNGDYGGSKTPLDQRDLWRTPPTLFASLMLSSAFNWMPPRRRITRCAEVHHSRAEHAGNAVG